MRRMAALALSIGLSGCALGTALHYDFNSQSHSYQHEGRNWVIADIAAEQRILVRPPVGELWVKAPIRGFTGGLVGTVDGAAIAALAWLNENKGGNCRLTTDDELYSGGREFRYACPEPLGSPVAPAAVQRPEIPAQAQPPARRPTF